MRCIPFYPENEIIYKHYCDQQGHGLPVFRGTLYQKGYGIAGLLSGLARHALPLIKSAVLPLIKKGSKKLGQIALQSGSEIIQNSLEGKPIKKTLKKVAKSRLDDLVKSATVTGAGGIKRLGIKRKRLTRSKPYKKIRFNDVFD